MNHVIITLEVDGRQLRVKTTLEHITQAPNPEALFYDLLEVLMWRMDLVKDWETNPDQSARRRLALQLADPASLPPTAKSS